jgi:Fanconi anemia group J protein
VGTSVLRLCQIIPDGILLFVPSYHLMDKLIKRWKSTDIWKKLSQVKGALVSEPKEAGSAFDASMRSFKTGVEAGRGALLIAVCKGKASEGIDFSDKYARGVLIVGIPFAAAKDTKVNLKKEFNNNPIYRHPGQKLVTGDVWYKQQAFRALNQALGRCIRHR